MKKQTKTLLLLVAFVVFIAAATLLYRLLTARVAPPSQIGVADETTSAVLPAENSGRSSAESAAEDSRTLAPDFTVTDSDGNDVKLSDLRGKPVVLNFWASWCPPCKGEMPDFDEVYADYGDDVHFMMIDLVDGERETQEKGAGYVAEMGFSFPVYYDLAQEAAYLYGVSSIPTTYILDGDGYVVTGARGAITGDDLLRGITMVMSEDGTPAQKEEQK